MLNNTVVLDLFRRNLTDAGWSESGSGERGQGSTDMGDVSHELPTIHPHMACAPEGTPGHSRAFRDCAGGPDGDRLAVDAAKVLGLTALDLLASPEIVDAEVTDVIEDAISGVEGIDYISSQSLQGQSVVTVFFHLHRDIDGAMVDVKNAVSAAANRLPRARDIDPPTISKVEPPNWWAGSRASIWSAANPIPRMGGASRSCSRQRRSACWKIFRPRTSKNCAPCARC